MKGFQRQSLGDYSPNMETAKLVITLNILSQSTQISNYHSAPTEKSPNLAVIPYSTCRAPSNRLQTPKTIGINTSTLSCLQIFALIAVLTSTSLRIKVPRGQQGNQMRIFGAMVKTQDNISFLAWTTGSPQKRLIGVNT